MKDIDFEELDRAVNRFLGGAKSQKEEQPITTAENNQHSVSIDSVANQAQETVSDRGVLRYASDLHQKTTPVQQKRVGRFMDIKPINLSEDKPTDENLPKPLKYTSRISTSNSSTQILDDFKPKMEIFKRSQASENLQDTLDTALELNIEEPVLDSIELDDIPQPKEHILLSEQINDIDPNQEIDQPSLTVEESVESAKISFKEPILNDVEVEKSGLTDEIVTSGTPGVLNIDNDENIETFGGGLIKSAEGVKTDSVNIERELISTSIETNNLMAQNEDKTNNLDLTNEEKIEERATEADSSTDEIPLTTPFLPNARVEKRPLGSAPLRFSKDDVESKIVNARTKRLKDQAERSNETPILNSDEYATPLKHKKSSGWWIVLVILIIAAVGVGAGILAHHLLLG